MGSGFRTFQSGEVLSSSNVQNYLMDQSVMVFAGTASRGSAISSPETGMVTYRTDGTADSKREGFEFYDGSSWTRLVPAASTGALVYLTQGTFSAVASVSMPASTFTSTYKNFRVILKVTSSSTHQALGVRVNVGGTAQTGSTYLGGWANTNIAGTMSGIGANSNTSAVPTYIHSAGFANLDLTVYDPNNSATYTSWSGHGRGADSGGSIAGCAGGGFQNSLQDNDGLSFVVGGTFGGTYYVYGIKDS